MTNKNAGAIAVRIQGQEIRRDERGWYCARDLGRALGYDADGGNLSRNFAHVQEWRALFQLGTDFDKDLRGRIWLSEHGMLQTLRLVAAIEREDRAAVAEEVLARYLRRERRTRSGMVPRAV